MSVLDNIIKHTPEFLAHKRQRQVETNALIQSGVIINSPELDRLARSAARTFIMPHNNPLSGSSSVLVAGQEAVAQRVVSGKTIATQNLRKASFKAHDLETRISGDDKMGYIANALADFWNRDMNVYVAAMLTGVFSSASMATNIYETDKDAGFEAILEGVSVLGDRSGQASVLVMNSKTELKLQREQFNGYVPTKQTDTGLTTYMNGRFQVIVDDVIEDNVIYALGQGAISFGSGTEGLEQTGILPLEMERRASFAESILHSREAFILHINGVSWVGQAQDEYPENSEIIVGTNWNRVYEPKNVAAVKIVLNVEQGGE